MFSFVQSAILLCTTCTFFTYYLVIGQDSKSLVQNEPVSARLKRVPSKADLARQCPSEARDRLICPHRALRGYCSGRTISAKIVRERLCRCTCDKYLSHRIQTCCKQVDSKPQCVPLCRYNTTTEEIGDKNSVQCASELPKWSYCGWDGRDGSKCCRRLGVPEDCLTFCKAEIGCAFITAQNIVKFAHCLDYYSTMQKCQMRSLTATTHWDSKWRLQC